MSNPNIRVYDSPGQGRYIHAGDLIDLFERNLPNADPIPAVVIPKVIAVLRSIQESAGDDQMSPEERDAVDRLENPTRWVGIDDDQGDVFGRCVHCEIVEIDLNGRLAELHTGAWYCKTTTKAQSTPSTPAMSRTRTSSRSARIGLVPSTSTHRNRNEKAL